MSSLSRRAAIRSMFAAVSGAALLYAGAARADQSGPDTPDPKKSTGPKGGAFKGLLTAEDRAINSKCINKTMNEAPTGATWKWNNPKTGNSGTVTPTSKAGRHTGQTCRNLTETITLKDGRTETIAARACKKADGSWSVVA